MRQGQHHVVIESTYISAWGLNNSIGQVDENDLPVRSREEHDVRSGEQAKKPCPHCHRSFAAKLLDAHVRVCEKGFKEDQTTIDGRNRHGNGKSNVEYFPPAQKNKPARKEGNQKPTIGRKQLSTRPGGSPKRYAEIPKPKRGENLESIAICPYCDLECARKSLGDHLLRCKEYNKKESGWKTANKLLQKKKPSRPQAARVFNRIRRGGNAVKEGLLSNQGL